MKAEEEEQQRLAEARRAQQERERLAAAAAAAERSERARASLSRPTSGFNTASRTILFSFFFFFIADVLKPISTTRETHCCHDGTKPSSSDLPLIQVRISSKFIWLSSHPLPLRMIHFNQVEPL